MSLRTETAPTETPSFATLYAEVQQFYAGQMHALDSGAAEEWASTFTEDGSFAPPSLPEPVVGRDLLTAGARQAAADLAERGEVHRHVFSMVSVRRQPDGSLRALSYVQVIATPRGKEPQLRLMCVCDDLLVREDDGELRVRERHVTRDDRPGGSGTE